MNINWKLKSLLFKGIDSFALYKLLYWLQKNLTKRTQLQIQQILPDWVIHQEHLAMLPQSHVLEFGAGKNLQQNIFLSQFFRQTVIDLFPMLDIGQANSAAMQIAKICQTLKYQPLHKVGDLLKFYNINYIAPLDLRMPPFEEDHFDACISTNTLEHIPKSDIVLIFIQLKKILRSGGLISAIIDYSDHYAHTDPRIGPLNYLKFSAAEFKQYNHQCHFQNRLRHSDYLTIFQELGFRILKSDPADFMPRPETIAAEFDCNDVTLCATRGVFLLQNDK